MQYVAWLNVRLVFWLSWLAGHLDESNVFVVCISPIHGIDSDVYIYTYIYIYIYIYISQRLRYWLHTFTYTCIWVGFVVSYDLFVTFGTVVLLQLAIIIKLNIIRHVYVQLTKRRGCLAQRSPYRRWARRCRTFFDRKLQLRRLPTAALRKNQIVLEGQVISSIDRAICCSSSQNPIKWSQL